MIHFHWQAFAIYFKLVYFFFDFFYFCLADSRPGLEILYLRQRKGLKQKLSILFHRVYYNRNLYLVSIALYISLDMKNDSGLSHFFLSQIFNMRKFVNSVFLKIVNENTAKEFEIRKTQFHVF